jgi:hypothetical protein
MRWVIVFIMRGLVEVGCFFSQATQKLPICKALLKRKMSSFEKMTSFFYYDLAASLASLLACTVFVCS